MASKTLVDQMKSDVSKLIGVSHSELNSDSTIDNTPGWDSLKHIELSLLLESKYSISPSPEHVEQMTTFKGICELINTKDPSMKAMHLTVDDFIDGLKEVGLKRGDNVFVQSSIVTFGIVDNPLETLKNAFLSVIGEEGTLAVPTFNFCFCRGETFDIDNTESEVGAFSEYIRKSQSALRSKSPPFHTVSAIGKYAKTLSNAISNTSFSKSSVFGIMHDLNFKICMFGTSFRSNTFFHYVEEQVRVPYRFFKSFTSTVTCGDKTESLSYDYYARYLEPSIKCDFHNIGEILLKEFKGRKIYIGAGPVYLVSARKLVDVTSLYLTNDPTLFVPEQDKYKIQNITNGIFKK